MQHMAPLKLKGLIIAGSAGLKHELVLDPPLQSLVMKVVDVEYGGMRGFHEAIESVRELLAHAPVVRERALISQFMEEIAKDTNKYLSHFPFQFLSSPLLYPYPFFDVQKGTRLV